MVQAQRVDSVPENRYNRVLREDLICEASLVKAMTTKIEGGLYPDPTKKIL